MPPRYIPPPAPPLLAAEARSIQSFSAWLGAPGDAALARACGPTVLALTAGERVAVGWRDWPVWAGAACTPARTATMARGTMTGEARMSLAQRQARYAAPGPRFR